MSYDALLTLLALLVAVYAIIPAERKLDLRLRLSVVDWALGIGAVLLVHYIKFYPVLDHLGLTLDLGPWRWGFTEESASYLVIVASGLVIGLRASTARLAPARLPLFRELADQLIANRRYSELAYLLARHFDTLLLTASEKSLRDRIASQIYAPFDTVSRRRKGWARWAQLRKWLAVRVALPERLADAARYTLRRILLDREFVAALARSKPDTAMAILQREFELQWDFLDVFVRELLADRRSVLYFEIEQNQNLTGGHRYYIPHTNRLLSFLLSNANRAYDLRVYRPVGDFAMDELDRLRLLREDPYNAPLDNDYLERGKWRCPLHAAIRFFDIMVEEALHQGVEWHMWLYYMEGLAGKIARNMNSHPAADQALEWPTRYHFLLYDIFDALENWIGSVDEVPPEQANVRLETDEVRHENHNIPKSAALALGMSYRHVILSASLSPKFKGYLLEGTLRLVRDLRRNPRTARYGELLGRAVYRGGPRLIDQDPGYVRALGAALNNVDFVLRLECRQAPEIGQLMGIEP